MSSIVLFELWHGVQRSPEHPENAERLNLLLAGGVDVVPFEREDSLAAGALRANLESLGTPIGPYDLLIAAQGLRTGATIVTANTREFARVPDLSWEDWST